MTRILIVKMTSMGDVLHVLPALQDISERIDDVSIDWMVEDSFADIPGWHPLVDRVIPVSSRRWRQISPANIRAFLEFVKTLRVRRYDYIIDAQGLMKSALYSRFARLKTGGTRIGFAGKSIKEWPAAWLYTKTVTVSRNEHAVERLRQLVCGGLDGVAADSRRSYSIKSGIQRAMVQDNNVAVDGEVLRDGSMKNAQSDTILDIDPNKAIFLFHGTTWASKHLPEQLWFDIAKQVIAQGYLPVLAWGNDVERLRAQRIAGEVEGAVVLPKMSLTELANIISAAAGAIAVDTGLGHLAAALDIPCVTLYGATDPALTGTYGRYQVHLQAEIACAPCLSKICTELRPGITEPPCYATFGVDSVWQTLARQISARKNALSV